MAIDSKYNLYSSLCMSDVDLGNTIALRFLDCPGIGKPQSSNSRIETLALAFLEASCALLRTRSGVDGILAGSARHGSPSGSSDRLHDDLRLLSSTFTDLDRFLLKRSTDEHKQGFSLFGRSRAINAESEKIQKALDAGRMKLQMTISTMFPSTDLVVMDPGSGYTDLLTIFEARLKRKSPTHVAVVTAALTRRDIPIEKPMPPVPSFGRIEPHSRSPPMFESDDTASVSFSDLAKYSPLSPEPSVRMSHSVSEMADDITLSGFRFKSMGMPSPSAETASTDTHDSVLSNSTREKSDYSTMPSMTHRGARVSPTGSGMSHTQKATLVRAVRSRDHRVIQQILESGTAPDGEPEHHLLHIAVSNGDLDTLRLLLRFGAQGDAPDRAGLTPLYAATQAMFLAGAQVLLQYGADPNLSVGTHGETPFAASLTEGKDHFALLYIDNGAHIHTTLANGNTPLTQAIETATDSAVVELMLNKGADANRKNTHGETALFKAINADRLDYVTALLSHNANPNLPGPKHMLWPAVHKLDILEVLLKNGANLKLAPGILELATSINSVEAVTLLLRHGADPDTKKDGIYTPLCSAIRDDREVLVDLLLQAKADPNLAALDFPTGKCVSYHRPHLLHKILSAGADPKHPKGLVEACVESNEAECLKILLKHGADVNERGASGNTALTTAIKHGDKAMIELLLQNGGNPAVRGQEWPVNLAVANPAILARLLQHMNTKNINKGALERAVMADQLESVKMLLAKGVDVEDRNGGVFSALTTSIREDRKAIFTYLLDEAGADPNSPGEHLPIIKAIRRHRADDLYYIQHLLERGADMNLMYRGWNAVLQALENGETEVFKLLAESGNPDLGAQDENGRTVLDMMQERGMREELQILLEGSSGTAEVRDALSRLRHLVEE
jgi:ankyrin repeat protein